MGVKNTLAKSKRVTFCLQQSGVGINRGSVVKSMLLKKRCFLDSGFFTVIGFRLFFAENTTTNRKTRILSNLPERLEL